MPSLYIVATPIGNLEDISQRALRVLREVDLIAAEDTRVTHKLLARYDIKTRLTSYRESNRESKLPELLDALEQGDVALVSDAGMPGINDPGSELVRAAAENGIPVVPVPGPSAVTTAIAVSGLPVGEFVYLGFLPRKKGERRRLLDALAGDPRTLVALETPHRLRGALTDLLDALGDRRIAVCRELTKLHEEVFRGVISEALDRFPEPRGEFTLVIEGAVSDEGGRREKEKAALDALEKLRADGFTDRDAVAAAAIFTGLPKSAVYRLLLDSRKASGGGEAGPAP